MMNSCLLSDSCKTQTSQYVFCKNDAANLVVSFDICDNGVQHNMQRYDFCQNVAKQTKLIHKLVTV